MSAQLRQMTSAFGRSNDQSTAAAQQRSKQAQLSQQNRQPNISSVLKKDANGKPIPGTNDGTLVRIRLFDDRERVLFFRDNQSPNAAQVCTMIAEKLDLKKESLMAFSLWIVGRDLELQIRPKMELSEMVAKWPRYMEKYTHSQDVVNATDYKFVFKREAMVSVMQERQIVDEVAIKLLYGEARNNVIRARYPVSLDDGIKLAAIQLQINYGEYNEAKHGFGTNFVLQSLSALLSPNLINKLKSTDWEAKITASWQMLQSKLQNLAAIGPYLYFLEHCREWPVYGCTFFPACKNIPPQGYFELRSDHLYVGVNAEGVCIVDDDRHKISWSGKFEGLEWECTPDSVTIEYMPAKSADGLPPKKLGSTLITPQAHLFDSLASRAIYLIEKAERKRIIEQKRASALQTLEGGRQSANTTIQPSASADAKRKSTQPGNVTRVNESSTIVEHDGEDASAGYLMAINEIRRPASTK
ncbi:hypothetical protein MIR68_004146 [Amoeboaphelidium protococcarum]|nr:hypothetical protein MIR68_004146 [Amoeboaphelidium protococcarum]